jgi:hypothetical protein
MNLTARAHIAKEVRGTNLSTLQGDAAAAESGTGAAVKGAKQRLRCQRALGRLRRRRAVQPYRDSAARSSADGYAGGA